MSSNASTPSYAEEQASNSSVFCFAPTDRRVRYLDGFEYSRNLHGAAVNHDRIRPGYPGARTSGPILAQAIGAALGLELDDQAHLDLEEGLKSGYGQTYYKAEETDWTLFTRDLPIIDADTDKFFADADASIQVAYVTIDEVTAIEIPVEDQDITLDDVEDAAVHDDIYEAITDFEIRSQPDYVPASPEYEQELEDMEMDLLESWAYTTEHHELLAYQFEQPPSYPHEEYEAYGYDKTQ